MKQLEGNGAADAVTRRAFLTGAACGLLGVRASAGNWSLLEPTNALHRPPRTARNVIYLYMRGGMSHVDTFDPKPGMAVQGPTPVTSTNSAEIQLSGHMTRLAQLADHLCVINSMTTTQGAHVPARYLTHTGYELRGTTRHPSLGAWVSLYGGRLNPALPAHVLVGSGLHTATGGFLSAEHAPLPIGDATLGLQDATRDESVDEERFHERWKRLAEMNREFESRRSSKAVREHAAAYEQAFRLMGSEDLAAFDLAEEPTALREAYGESPLGQGALLARRLVEHGVRFVEVVGGGWDTHVDNFRELSVLVPNLDRVLSTLLLDLDSRGLLDETLIVVTTEFGRTPQIVEHRRGRNHHPQAFSSVLAGGGVIGGRRYGQTNATGEEVLRDPVTAADLNATISYALGLPLAENFTAQTGEEFTVANRGEPIRELFG